VLPSTVPRMRFSRDHVAVVLHGVAGSRGEPLKFLGNFVQHVQHEIGGETRAKSLIFLVAGAGLEPATSGL
jgi:hypothetical protein